MIGTIDGLKLYAQNNYYTFADEDLPAMLREANLYLRGLNWKGDPEFITQQDIFPRIIEDDDGYESTVATPEPVVVFTYMIACDAADKGVDMTSVAGGSKVKMERVEGAIQVEYSEASLFQSGFTADYMDSMIGPWLGGRGRNSANISARRS